MWAEDSGSSVRRGVVLHLKQQKTNSCHSCQCVHVTVLLAGQGHLVRLGRNEVGGEDPVQKSETNQIRIKLVPFH